MTPTTLLRRLSLAIAGAVMLAAATGAHAERLVGSGKPASEARTVGAFQAVHLKGPIDLEIRQSATHAVEVRGDDNLLPVVETRVVDGGGLTTLEVDVRRGTSFTSRSKLVVMVDVAALQVLALSGSGTVVADGIRSDDLKAALGGSGDMRLNQLEAGALTIAISGSGDVVASGRTGALQVAISGSGDVAARELQADEVKVRIAGSGDASVHARKTLAVKIVGSGDVSHSGDAVPTVSVSGSGSVKKR